MTNPLPDSLDGTSKMDWNLVVPSKILPVNSKKTKQYLVWISPGRF